MGCCAGCNNSGCYCYSGFLCSEFPVWMRCIGLFFINIMLFLLLKTYCYFGCYDCDIGYHHAGGSWSDGHRCEHFILAVDLCHIPTLSKRRHELVLLGENSGDHRKSLREYNPYLLDQMISAVTASAIISYALYTTSQETVSKFGTRNLIFTLPFVIYGIFRYLYLIHEKNMGGSPELVFIQDRSMIINIVLYCIVVVVVLYIC